MRVQADLLVRDVLRDGFAAVQADLTLVDTIFADRPPEERQITKDFLAQARVPVELGWPHAEPQLPGIWVLLGGGPETRAPIGSLFGHDADGEAVLETEGVYRQVVIRAMGLSLNMDLLVWLQGISEWALDRARDVLTAAGLLEQSLSVSDLEPLPQVYPPDFAFRRDVVLVAQIEATHQTTWPRLAGVEVTGTAYGLEGVTIARRR